MSYDALLLLFYRIRCVWLHFTRRQTYDWCFLFLYVIHCISVSNYYCLFGWLDNTESIETFNANHRGIQILSFDMKKFLNRNQIPDRLNFEQLSVSAKRRKYKFYIAWMQRCDVEVRNILQDIKTAGFFFFSKKNYHIHNSGRFLIPFCNKTVQSAQRNI